jgi:hypothetical protein
LREKLEVSSSDIVFLENNMFAGDDEPPHQRVSASISHPVGVRYAADDDPLLNHLRDIKAELARLGATLNQLSAGGLPLVVIAVAVAVIAFVLSRHS